MDYGLSDSSGTDDDLPPSHQNRFSRGGRASGNGRSGVLGSASFPRMHTDMEAQIHQIEQEAYSSVLRAFKAQSDAITWEKESLITELRKELRVSDEEHRELLSRVNADDIIRSIREWRKGGGLQPGRAAQPVHDSIPSPTVSVSRKKQKTSQSIASLSLGAPSPAFHPSMRPSSSALKQAPTPRSKSKKTKAYPSAGLTGRPEGAVVGNEAAEGTAYDPFIGKRVWTRWPEDNHFYEAVVTDYNPIEGRHALVYDINTTNETWEWVNLKEISPEDIKWEGDESGMSRRGGRPRPGRGMKKSAARGGAVTGAGRGRAPSKGQTKKDFPPQNGLEKKDDGFLEIYNTDSLIKEVERVVAAANPDSVQIQDVKKMLKEQEQALVDIIAKLDEASDGESEEAGDPQEDGGRADGRVAEGSNGENPAGEGRAASDDEGHDDQL